MITREEVERLAELARLALTDAEVTQYAGELGAVLGYIEQLSEVDVTDVEPTSQVTGLMNVLRDDVLNQQRTVSHDELRALAPAFRDGYVVVPAVFGGGDE